MKNIYLIGMPGCGKSTIGKSVSSSLDIKFIDLDEYIVSFSGRTIADMFEEGESIFRKAETDSLKEVAKKENLIVATGGGVVVTPENIDIMQKSGTVIFIDCEAETILKNCSLEGRPLLRDKNKIYDLYNNRIALYRKAAMHTVQNDGSFDEAVKKTEEMIKAESNTIIFRCK